MTDLTKTNVDLRPRDDLEIEKVEEDFLILDKRNQKIHRLNATASIIWASLQEGRRTDVIVKQFVENFDILSEVAEKDVTRVLEEFRALNLLADQA